MLPSLVWVITIYLVTGLSESLPSPDLLEVQRIIIHTLGYAFLGWLMVIAREPRPIRVGLILVGLALLVGAGQEILQSLSRGRVYLAASLFDLGVDGIGAALGLLLGARWQPIGKLMGRSPRR